jgi:hypothetical protein
MSEGRDGTGAKPDETHGETSPRGMEPQTGDPVEEADADEQQDEEDFVEPTQREAIDAALAELRSLPALKRYRVIASAAFVVLYLGMMLLRGLHEDHIRPVLPYLAWYFDGLGLARTWGMFAHPSTELPVYIYGVTDDDRELQLSPPRADGFHVRIRDQRMRKVRSHMANKDQRGRWGADLSQYFCRSSAEQGVPLRFVRITEINRMGAGQGKTLLQTRCKG